MAEVAAASGVPIETLRKIETGRIATPAFFTVAALAAALAIPLDDVVRRSSDPPRSVRRAHRVTAAGPAVVGLPDPAACVTFRL